MQRIEKIQKVKIEKIIKIELVRGSGLHEKEPVRIVIQYWDLKGNLIYDSDNKVSASSEISS